MKFSRLELGALIFLVFFVYVIFFRTVTVEYSGGDETWDISIRTSVKGLKAGYSYTFKYKGSGEVTCGDYRIYPHFNGHTFSLDKTDFTYQYDCEDCGFYGREEVLYFFIVWEEKGTGEKMKWLQLNRVRK